MYEKMHWGCEINHTLEKGRECKLDEGRDFSK